MLFVATSHDTWPFLLLFLFNQVTTPFCSYNFCFCSFYRNELRSYTVSHFILTSFPPNPFCLSFLYCVSWKWMTAEKDLLRTLKHVRAAHPYIHLRRPTRGSRPTPKVTSDRNSSWAKFRVQWGNFFLKYYDLSQEIDL